MKKRFTLIPVSALALIVCAAAVTAPRSSGDTMAPLLPGAQVDPQALAAIQRSCSDCHSGRTHYPWYSYIPPTSWLIRRNVTQGRERLNFSKWNEYPVLRRERLLSEIANQVKDGGMPPALYTLVHMDSTLSETDVDAIFQWTQTERARLIESTYLR